MSTTRHFYWPGINHVLSWTKVEVRLSYKWIPRVSFLPVGTIVCREDLSQQLADPVTTSLHQLPSPAPRGPRDGNSSLETNLTSTATAGTSNYPDGTKNHKGQYPDPRSLNLLTPLPRITRNFGPQTVSETTPNPGSHPVETAAPDINIEVEHHGRSLDDPEPEVVRRFFISTYHPSLVPCTI